MDHEEPKQLKLTPKDPLTASQSGGQGKKEKKEGDHRGNKWVILAILVISVIVSLIFYLSGKRPEKTNSNQNQPLGGQKVYQF